MALVMSLDSCALAVSADSPAECLERASEMLTSGQGMVLLDGDLVLRRVPSGLVAQVIDPAPSAHRCQNEYEVMVENARHALAASPLSGLLPALPVHWQVIEESDDGGRIAWRASP